MNYGESIADASRLSGVYAARIVNGEKPGKALQTLWRSDF